MAKKDLSTINLTQAEAEAFDQIKTDLVPRLSNRRCKVFLVNRVREGAIQISDKAIGAVTYKAVMVKGTEVDLPGRKKPDVELTKKQFSDLDASGVADLIEEHTTEKRAAYVVGALLSNGLVVPTARDLVYLSNGRIAVDGIMIESSRKGLDMSSLVAGVTIGKPAADTEAA